MAWSKRRPGRRINGRIRAQLTTCTDRGKKSRDIPEHGVIKRTQEARLKKTGDKCGSKASCLGHKKDAISKTEIIRGKADQSRKS